jgi:hypothetical protein
VIALADLARVRNGELAIYAIALDDGAPGEIGDQTLVHGYPGWVASMLSVHDADHMVHRSFNHSQWSLRQAFAGAFAMQQAVCRFEP